MNIGNKYKYSRTFFWKHWQNEYLRTLQTRRKWPIEHSNVKPGDVVLLREKNVQRGQWPMGIIETVIRSDDGLVRTVEVRVVKDKKCVTYKRPISEFVLLLD